MERPVNIPQKPEIPATIPGMVEAEAVAEQAHTRFEDAEQRIRAATQDAAQGHVRRDALKVSMAAGEAVQPAEIAAVDAVIREAESAAALLVEMLPDLRRQIDAAELAIQRLAEKAGQEMAARVRGYMDDLQRFEQDLRAVKSEATALHQSFAPPLVGVSAGQDTRHLVRWAPSSAARQQAWNNRKDQEAQARREAARRDAEERASADARGRQQAARDEEQRFGQFVMRSKLNDVGIRVGAG
jgi:hypothetical protein